MAPEFAPPASADAGHLHSVEAFEIADVDEDAARAPAVVRPDRRTHDARCAKAYDSNRDVARRIPIERPPGRIGPHAVDNPWIIDRHVEIVRLIGLDDDVFGWQRLARIGRRRRRRRLAPDLDLLGLLKVAAGVGARAQALHGGG